MTNEHSTKLSTSFERDTFQRDSYIERCVKEGKDLSDPTVVAMIAYFNHWIEERRKFESNEKFYKNNLEYDLRNTEWILLKVRQNDDYAQKLYAALCNNDFQQQEVWQVLKNQSWSCSWRYAGGVLADMRGEGDYLDWYCTGGEGYVDEEIEEDLLKLGWRVVK